MDLKVLVPEDQIKFLTQLEPGLRLGSSRGTYGEYSYTLSYIQVICVMVIIVEEEKSTMDRINGVVDKPGMQQGPRLDVTRKGNRVPTSCL